MKLKLVSLGLSLLLLSTCKVKSHESETSGTYPDEVKQRDARQHIYDTTNKVLIPILQEMIKKYLIHQNSHTEMNDHGEEIARRVFRMIENMTTHSSPPIHPVAFFAAIKDFESAKRDTWSDPQTTDQQLKELEFDSIKGQSESYFLKRGIFSTSNCSTQGKCVGYFQIDPVLNSQNRNKSYNEARGWRAKRMCSDQGGIGIAKLRGGIDFCTTFHWWVYAVDGYNCLRVMKKYTKKRAVSNPCTHKDVKWNYKMVGIGRNIYGQVIQERWHEDFKIVEKKRQNLRKKIAKLKKNSMERKKLEGILKKLKPVKPYKDPWSKQYLYYENIILKTYDINGKPIKTADKIISGKEKINPSRLHNIRQAVCEFKKKIGFDRLTDFSNDDCKNITLADYITTKEKTEIQLPEPEKGKIVVKIEQISPETPIEDRDIEYIEHQPIEVTPKENFTNQFVTIGPTGRKVAYVSPTLRSEKPSQAKINQAIEEIREQYRAEARRRVENLKALLHKEARARKFEGFNLTSSKSLPEIDEAIIPEDLKKLSADLSKPKTLYDINPVRIPQAAMVRNICLEFDCYQTPSNPDKEIPLYKEPNTNERCRNDVFGEELSLTHHEVFSVIEISEDGEWYLIVPEDSNAKWEFTNCFGFWAKRSDF